MDEFYFQRSHVPAFGSWDCYDDLPFTQCFESARQAGLLRYTYSEERDLYVAGDLYENDTLTPAMIVVPRSATGKTGYPQEKEGKQEAWAAPRPAPKAVDEDLYKISPHLLRQQAKRVNLSFNIREIFLFLKFERSGLQLCRNWQE
ncbi:hypothetical protein PHJA_001261100 [Phtheirospermum japonicum]|uniref:RIN4 pathogenic type III effector avirulence factor Avr cleavage site domain-containing protein n=1 Tax=Phtheirospermum japonicum TaxID=374723 RepID=A0A830CAA4_9LAMI|nr:hypothetical protein PHJA_001261100 [Phtheirospermum japonicum]